MGRGRRDGSLERLVGGGTDFSRHDKTEHSMAQGTGRHPAGFKSARAGGDAEVGGGDKALGIEAA